MFPAFLWAGHLLPLISLCHSPGCPKSRGNSAPRQNLRNDQVRLHTSTRIWQPGMSEGWPWSQMTLRGQEEPLAVPATRCHQVPPGTSGVSFLSLHREVVKKNVWGVWPFKLNSEQWQKPATKVLKSQDGLGGKGP